MRPPFAALLAAAFCLSVFADPLPPLARAEVIALLDRLQASGCEFNRNGAWHSSAEARAHLLRKLEYLEDRNAVKSAEQFIDLGASRSSTSGKPYLVKCGSSAPVESKAWLSAGLQAIRQAAKAEAPVGR